MNSSVSENKSIIEIVLISILSMAELVLSLNTITITNTIIVSDFNILTILFFIIAILALYEAILCFNSSKKDFIRNLINMAAYMSCFILLFREVCNLIYRDLVQYGEEKAKALGSLRISIEMG